MVRDNRLFSLHLYISPFYLYSLTGANEAKIFWVGTVLTRTTPSHAPEAATAF